MKITSEEIARLAHVSRSTVSRVVNNYPNVPEETRRKVMTVIEKYGYEPNSYARVLAGKCNKEIALCVAGYNNAPGIQGLHSQYYMRLISSLVEKGQDYGYRICVCLIRNPRELNQIEHMYLNREIAGAIFIGFEYLMEDLKPMIAKDYNMVIMDAPDCMEGDHPVKFVYTDNERAGYLAGRYLLEAGFENPIHISGDGRLSSVEREKGFRRALREAGRKDEEICVIAGDFDQDMTHAVMERLLDEKKHPGIFLANDQMAMVAVHEAIMRGLRIPEDLAIMGCDFEPQYYTFGWNLTSVELPLGELAELAIAAVLGKRTEKTSIGSARIITGTTV